MTTIEAIIERAKDGTYTIYCKHDIFSGAGTSIEDAKKDLLRQMAFYKETAQEEGFKYPEYLDGTKPRKAQAERMEQGFRNLKTDLDAVFA